MTIDERLREEKTVNAIVVSPTNATQARGTGQRRLLWCVRVADRAAGPQRFGQVDAAAGHRWPDQPTREPSSSTAMT